MAMAKSENSDQPELPVISWCSNTVGVNSTSSGLTALLFKLMCLSSVQQFYTMTFSYFIMQPESALTWEKIGNWMWQQQISRIASSVHAMFFLFLPSHYNETALACWLMKCHITDWKPCAYSKHLNHTAQLHILVAVFICHCSDVKIHWLHYARKNTDQIGLTCRLIWAFPIHTDCKVPFQLTTIVCLHIKIRTHYIRLLKLCSNDIKT